MFDLVEFCKKEFEKENSVILLPSLGIFSVDGYFTQDNTIFVQRDSVSGVSSYLDKTKFNELNPHSDPREDFIVDSSEGCLINFITPFTGINKEVFLESDLAVLTCHVEESNSLQNNEDVETFLKKISTEAFNALNVIRFIHCDLYIPDKLPYIPGYWYNSDGYFGALILKPNGDNEIIAGREMGGAVSYGLGIGLESGDVQYMEHHPLSSLHTEEGTNTVGKMIRHALVIYNRAMYSNSETLKFITIMALFEFLGTGDKYTNFKKVRPKLQAHIARNRQEYDKLTDQFQLFTSKKNGNANIGYRTRIIHEGALIEELLPDKNDRKLLFSDLTRYTQDIIKGMEPFAEEDFSVLQEYRQQLLRDIGIQTSG